MRNASIASALIILIAWAGTSVAEEEDFSKRIVGTWLGPKKLKIFYADGTWGVQRNESEPENKSSRHWSIKGNKLTESYPSNGTIVHGVLTIIELTSERLIVESDGYRVEYRRWAE